MSISRGDSYGILFSIYRIDFCNCVLPVTGYLFQTCSQLVDHANAALVCLQLSTGSTETGAVCAHHDLASRSYLRSQAGRFLVEDFYPLLRQA
jgi:hypothetical protein